MIISKTMVKRHLEYLTLGYLGFHDAPPEDLTEYDSAVRELRLAAEGRGDLPYLKLALDWLLTTPHIDLREYDGGQYPYGEDQLGDLFRYAWEALWPGERLSAPGEAAPVELVEMPRAEWDELKAGRVAP